MMKLSARTAMALVVFMTLSPMFSTELALADDQKPTAMPRAKAIKPKGEARFQTAETAAKATSCFGVAPQIDQLVPDEGRPGVRVTIKGAEFGSPDCLRSVSFGPGQAPLYH